MNFSTTYLVVLITEGEKVMQTLELDNNKMNKLLQDKRLTINYDKAISLEIYDNELTLNNNGEIFVLDSANLKFRKEDNTHYLVVDDLKKRVCDHLNLNWNEVILETYDPQETVFKVRIIPERELYLIVCTQLQAFTNIKENLGPDYTKNKQIGLYRQLDNSLYYFRWCDEL